MINKKKDDFYNHRALEENDDDYDLHDHSPDLEEENKSIFSKIIPKKENREYAQTVTKGFIWIFMVLVSFLSIFLIFKTPYYEYYNQTTPIVVDEGNPFVEQPNSLLNDYNKLEINNNTSSNAQAKNLPSEVLSEEPEEQKKVPVVNNNALPKNTENKSLKVDDTSIEDVLSNKTPAPVQNDLYTNKQDSEITKALKQAEGIPQQGIKAQPSNPIKPEENLQNVMPKPVEQTTQTTKKPVLEIIKNDKSVKIDLKVLWVVNIYSTKNQGLLNEKLIQIMQGKEKLFNNSTFYFTEYLLNGRKNYRISVVDKKIQKDRQPVGYATQEEASSFCQTLRENNVDCFTSSTTSNLLAPVVRN